MDSKVLMMMEVKLNCLNTAENHFYVLVQYEQTSSLKEVLLSQRNSKKNCQWHNYLAITTIKVNFILIPGEVGKRQHKMTCPP